MSFRYLYVLLGAAAVYSAEQPSAVHHAIADPYNNVCIPHIVSGNGWKTTITLANMDTKASNFSLLFVDPSGRDMSLKLDTPVGSVTDSEISGTIPTNGSLTLETSGGGTNLVQGWGLLVHNGIGGRNGVVAGQAIFQQQVTGKPAFEAVAPLTAISEHRVRLPFDNTNGFQTGVALANFYTVGVTISAPAYNEKGEVIGTGNLPLPAIGQRAFVLGDVFGFTSKSRGVIELVSSGEYMCSLGLRFHPGGAFTSTSPLSLPLW